MKHRNLSGTAPAGWSPKLTAMTYAALCAPTVGMGAQLCLKHIDGRFGRMPLEELIAGRWIVTDPDDGSVMSYGSARLLVRAGWAID